MKVNDKLAFFSRIAAQEAEQQRAEILAGIEEEINEAITEYTKQIEKQARQRLQNESNKIEQSKNKEIIHAAAEAKKSVIELRGRLIDELFANVAEKVQAYTRTELYRKCVLQEIQEISGRYPQAKVFLMEKDMNLAALAPVECAGVKDDFIGGFKLFIPEKNAVEDHTYLARIENARENFALMKISDNHHPDDKPDAPAASGKEAV